MDACPWRPLHGHQLVFLMHHLGRLRPHPQQHDRIVDRSHNLLSLHRQLSFEPHPFALLLRSPEYFEHCRLQAAENFAVLFFFLLLQKLLLQVIPCCRHCYEGGGGEGGGGTDQTNFIRVASPPRASIACVM